jgi:hypothetical protein
MTTHDIDIEYSGKLIGSIDVTKSPKHLQAVRTASGFEIQIPIVLSLLTLPRDMPRMMVSNLRGKVFIKRQDSSLIAVGRVSAIDWESAGVASGESYQYEREKSLEWTPTFDDIAYIEKIRDGQSPEFQIELRGEWCLLMPVSEGSVSKDRQARFPGTWYYRTDPMSIVTRTGYIDVSYPREVWIKMIRKLGVAENVLVEVPLPSSPKGQWEPVWKALVDARNAFEQGGSTGWKGCVTSVRLALEKWRKIDPEKPGPGWQTPKVPDREAWTKTQRLDAIRWYLLQTAHLGAHTGADEWSRDDALLMLSTLSALLAERKP